MKRGTRIAMGEFGEGVGRSGACLTDARLSFVELARMDRNDTPSVLAVGARLANLTRAKSVGDVSHTRASLVEVGTSREALALLRVVPFDLVAVGDQIRDSNPQAFAERLQKAKPWQKWLMVSDEALSADEEVMFRTLGAIAILDGPDAWREVLAIARKLRRSRPEATVPGFSLEPAGQ